MTKLLLIFTSFFISIMSVAQSRSSLLAVVEQRSSLSANTEREVLLSTVIEVDEDGAVYVTDTNLKRGGMLSEDEISSKTEYCGYYKPEQILNLKNTVNLLETKLPLVEAKEAYLCESGSISYRVFQKGNVLTLQEINDCTPNRIRQNAGEEEAKVLSLLEDLQKNLKLSR